MRLEKQKMILENPPTGYLRISSGLGEGSPHSIIVLPLIFEGQVKGVLELASFEGFNPTHHAFLDQLTESIGIVLNTIEANMRTEGLLQAVAVARAAIADASGGTQNRRTRNYRRRHVCSPSRTRKSNARIAKSSKRVRNWKKRRSSLHSRPSTNPSSWRTCRMNCGRRSIAC